jgi:hypothetical protein
MLKKNQELNLENHCYGLNCVSLHLLPKNSYAEVLTRSTAECVCIWRKGLYRGN